MRSVSVPHQRPEDYPLLAQRLEHDRAELLRSLRVLTQPVRAADYGRALLQQLQRAVPKVVLVAGAVVLAGLAARRLGLRGLMTLSLELWRMWPMTRRMLTDILD